MQSKQQYIEAPEYCQFCGTELEEVFLPNDQVQYICNICDGANGE